MSKAGHAAHAEAAETRRDRVRARGSRLASAGLIVVLLALSAVAIGSSQLTARAGRQAAVADVLNDDYSAAATAVAAEESLERKYRLEPSPAVLARYASAADDLVAALQLVKKDGGAGDRAIGQSDPRPARDVPASHRADVPRRGQG